jgi:FkbM family methyltransferase
VKFLKIIFKIKNLLRSKIWFLGLINNIAANIELENLIKDIKFKTVLDIGSNKGQFILLIENFFKDVEIYSFEPIKEILEKQKIFFKFKKNIFFFNVGLGEKIEKKNFHITKRKDSSSFLKSNINKNTDYQINENRLIQIETLDNLLLNRNFKFPILAKIDVQGYELKVLKGADTLLKKIKYLIVEVSEDQLYINQPISNEIINYLKEKNFIVLKQNLPTKIQNSNSIQRDILFLNQLID